MLTLAISLYTFPIYKVLMLKTFPDANKNVLMHTVWKSLMQQSMKLLLLLWYLFLMHLGMVNRAATVDLQD